MTPVRSPLLRGAPLKLALSLLLAGASSAQAQVAAPPTPAAPTPDEQARDRAARAEADRSRAGSARDDVIALTPFEVRAEANGYQAQNTMSGTRINSRLEDLAASITVVTKQQLIDTAAVDLNDIFSNEGNTEGIYQYTQFTNDRGNIVDNVSLTPETSNRIRGLGNANLATNGFRTSSAIPVDVYNVDAVEISRGPNSSLFGVGEPSGTINLIRGRANTARDVTIVSARVDDRGSFRSTVDFNRVLLDNKLAARVAAVHDDVEYVRKPSSDRTNRLTASLSYRPFKNTLITGSYEAYQNSSSRANSTTPRDVITEWRNAGSPVWDPTFNNIGGYRLLNGSTYTPVTFAQEAALLPRGLITTSTGFSARPSLFVNPDGSIGRYEVNRATNTVAAGVVPSPGTINSNLHYVQLGTALQRGGGVFGVPISPLFIQPGVTDKSIYNWEEDNYASPNLAKKRADIYQVQLEQTILRGDIHQLAFQAGYYREKIENNSRSYIGASDGAPAILYVDVNEKYLDGTPNPYFLRPYFAGSEMQTFKRPEENDQARATLAYQVDLTRLSNAFKWLGRHNFAGYGEFRQNIFAPNGLRYRDQIISNEPWHTAANLTNLPGRGAENRFYTRYYAGGSIAEPGTVLDYGPAAPNSLYGTQTLRYYNGPQALNEPVEVGEVYFALGKQKTQLRTKGIIWQGFLADSRIIPTLGFREDTIRAVNNVAVPLAANGYLDESFLDEFPDTWNETSGPTETRGIVVAPFSNWRAIDRRAEAGNVAFEALRGVRFHYNESDSFQPEALAYNVFGEVLPNTTSQGKDYGFSFSFKTKFYLKFTRYDTQIINSRSGSTAGLGSRPLRLDFDVNGEDSVFGDNVGGDNFDLEDTAYNWVTALNPGISLQDAAARVYGIMGVTRAYVDSVKNRTIADINNTQSKGTEIEISVNPTRHWTTRVTLTEQLAIDTTVSPNLQRYVDERLPVWTTVRVPTDPLPGGGQLPNAGRLWWEVGSAIAPLLPTADNGTNAPRNYYAASVDAPYKLAVTNAGKQRPQTRKYRANLTTNYRLAGLNSDIGWLNRMSVGGTLRWEDEAVVGYLGKAPEADGAIRELDGNKPIFDKARYSADLMLSYNFKFWRDRIDTRLQLNVRNVLEDGRLQAVGYNPDGTPWNFRIVDPRQFLLTVTFSL